MFVSYVSNVSNVSYVSYVSYHANHISMLIVTHIILPHQVVVDHVLCSLKIFHENCIIRSSLKNALEDI